MDDDGFALAAALRRELTELEGVEGVDLDELAERLAMRAESYFGM
ncbi:hypothetical protein NW249_24025 [Streptomyces sp. OUCMDZ-4982]|nr:hypothetical protein [Streptomyces sp. OUCMDZ-4982]MCR8945189.1 hypothetical protein [Streptomyces sp. OUCMDZ-4982]